MTAEILVLRLVHILGGIFWVGSGLFTTFFLMPALAASGPAAGQVMAGLQQRRLFTVLPIVALLTIASGLRLMWIMSAGFAPAYFASGPGRTYVWSGAAAIIGFLISVGVARPVTVRAMKLSASLATAPDSAREGITARLAGLRRLATIASIIAVALVVLAAAGMAIARYVR
ncbi:MAG: hypothetical protein WD802_00310 [Gemmatimonadaceae bacterium]